MDTIDTTLPKNSLRFDGADLEIRARLGGNAMTIDVLKSGACIHRVTIDDAAMPLEHSWIADLFAREHKIELGALAREVDDYVGSLNINQG
jgi:hypothetical protein